MDNDSLVDDCTLDSVPDDLRASYYHYLLEANSEKTLTGRQWMLWRESGSGKASDFYTQHSKKDN